MTPTDLSNRLSRMYKEAPHGEATVAIHLFGIRYAAYIRASGASATAIVKASDVPESYITEVHKGIALARHVVEPHEERSPGWVTKRASSTPEGVFRELKDQVRADVEEYNALRPDDHPHSRFSFDEEESVVDTFSLVRDWQYAQSWASFHLNRDVIEARSRDGRGGDSEFRVNIAWDENDSYTANTQQGMTLRATASQSLAYTRAADAYSMFITVGNI